MHALQLPYGRGAPPCSSNGVNAAELFHRADAARRTVTVALHLYGGATPSCRSSKSIAAVPHHGARSARTVTREHLHRTLSHCCTPVALLRRAVQRGGARPPCCCCTTGTHGRAPVARRSHSAMQAVRHQCTRVRLHRTLPHSHSTIELFHCARTRGRLAPPRHSCAVTTLRWYTCTEYLDSTYVPGHCGWHLYMRYL